MELIWANGDTDGADGLFDQPSEVLFLPDGRLVVVNIDAPSPGMVNSRPDAVPHPRRRRPARQPMILLL